MRVLYWNTNKRRAPAETVLREDYDVIAMQEPWRDPSRGTIYCPRMSEYYGMDAGAPSRAVIYVHKRHALKSWTSRVEKDWCSVTFTGDSNSEPLTIYSIYAERKTGNNWNTPIHTVGSETRRGQIILTGDFNLHHPLWDREGRTDVGSELLLDWAERWQLRLVTPWGETTRRMHGDRDSTLDHAWASEGVSVRYEGDPGHTGSDHTAQVIQVGDGAPRAQPQAAPEGWSWKSMDRNRVKEEAKGLRLKTDLTNPQELDEAVEDLIRQLQEIADETVPRRKLGNRRATPWWDGEVSEMVRRTRRARRKYIAVRSDRNWEHLQEADREQQQVMRAARRKCWRRVIAEASKDNKKIWTLERWARLRSHGPQELVKLPSLGRTEGEEPTATTHEEKTGLLAERFFPNPEADLSDILDRTWADETFRNPFGIQRTVDASEITEILRRTGAWKAPGTSDWLPTGFLKACGRPLAEILAKITNASFALEYYPRRFRAAGVVVLAKPGKTIAQKQTPGGWRPIALLSAVGKVIEAVIGRRIADAAEEHGLLPEGQMGNRRERSTELAIRMVTDSVYTAWLKKAITSLLQLDIKGAFDTVNHIRLLDTMRRKRFPPWLVRWLRSYLEDRTAQLRFDGGVSEEIRLPAGVPQGSPLSPVLFLLYIATLYEALADCHGIVVVGFADDTNLMAFSRDVQANCRRLEAAWKVCEHWAKSRGMEFAPQKSELMHFTRAHRPLPNKVRLGGTEVTPVESARFLGVWLDRKLRWRRHLAKVKTKLETQIFALTKLAASTWGCSLARAREIYTKVIRSAIAYGASAFHKPADPQKKKPRGIAKELLTAQSNCLRVVAGAYRATPVRSLETETWVPPLDLYLSKRVAEFEARLERTGKAALLRAARGSVASAIRCRRTRRTRRGASPAPARIDIMEGTEARAAWAAEWQDRSTPDEALERDWRERWQRLLNETMDRRPGRDMEPADYPEFTQVALRKHTGLKKHESSVLVQMRTGKIGLRAFLYGRRVPDIESPLCRCGIGDETPLHLATACPGTERQRANLRRELGEKAFTDRAGFDAATADGDTGRVIARWLLRLGRLKEFRLAMRLARDSSNEEE